MNRNISNNDSGRRRMNVKFDEVERRLKEKRISNTNDHRIEGMTQKSKFQTFLARVFDSPLFKMSQSRSFEPPYLYQINP